MSNPEPDDALEGVAIIGMAGRFPGARNVAEFWRNLRDGVESMTHFTDEELEASGIDPTVFRAANYVRGGFVVEDVELFDASFFGFNPREGAVLDPQHRLFMECAWEALEQAGYDPDRYEGRIGLYAGASQSSYYFNLLSNREVLEADPGFQFMILHGNDKDYLTTRTSYKLNLRGPSVTVQTACSTSLVAVALACQSLLTYQCDMALAGGVSLRVPQKAGHHYQEESIYSPDGHSRVFDAAARGTAPSNGLGIVTLKRLADAVEDGDHVYAVIKGSALNNDGSVKIGYTAPSVEGQAEVIAEALAMAGVDAGSISYVEAHGTGTSLGDPIELDALTQVFRRSTDARAFCGIGSVKSNIGHTGAAAGVAGLIKTALALKHGQLPASLHYERPNPNIDFEGGPFYVNTQLREWGRGGEPRRAGVSSFGIGGTNAHVVVEEAPTPEPSGDARPWQLLVLSARTGTALETATANLARHLEENADANLADVAYTLQVGRKTFGHRRALVCRDREDAVAALNSRDPRRLLTRAEDAKNRQVVFMFPGGGAQYVDMGLDLYRGEPVYREQVESCCELLKPILGYDLRDYLYPAEGATEENSKRLRRISVALPALFVTEYATARLLMSWGVRPEAMIGHSMGEYTAACLAGVMSLEDALRLITLRGQLFERLPKGAMLSIALPESQVRPWLGDKLSLAAVNGPAMSLVSGTAEAVDELAALLTEKGQEFRRLQLDTAAHSELVEPILGTFKDFVATIRLEAPRMPFLSNVTGTWITAEEATDPEYWARHLRQTVRFADGLGELFKEPGRIVLEVGPGQTLSTLARLNSDNPAALVSLSTLRHPQETQADVPFLLNTLGKLWLAGAGVDWAAFHGDERRRRVPLPTYPFERQRYWIERQKLLPGGVDSSSQLRKKTEVAEWFYVPSWKRTALPKAPAAAEEDERKPACLLFEDACGVGAEVARRLGHDGVEVVVVKAGEEFNRLGERTYIINPREKDDYLRLLEEVRGAGRWPGKVIHLWGVTPRGRRAEDVESFERAQHFGYYSLLFLVQGLARVNVVDDVQLQVVTNGVQEVSGEEETRAEKATALAACKVIQQEYPNVGCRSIDVDFDGAEAGPVGRLYAELTAKTSAPVVALRGAHRWEQTFEPVRLESSGPTPAPLREGGVYLITGGLGGVGLLLAEHLAEAVRAKLILTGRTPLPERAGWERWVETHDEQDEVSRKLRRLLRVEEMGAEVVVLSADVSDEAAMRRVVEVARSRFGRVNGVFHAAGIVGETSKCSVQELTVGEIGRHFRPKAHGLFVLESVLRDEEPDFCMLLSSLAAVLGGLGFYAYAASNLFMDAFAQSRRGRSRFPWVSVNFDGWQLKGEGEKATGLGSSMARLAMTPAEGLETVRRILSAGVEPQVAVSTGSLQARIDRWVKLESLRAPAAQEQAETAASLHERPALQTDYVAPSTEVEQLVARHWAELLGVERVGVYDNFFELGGHSLLAIQLISRLRAAFQMEFSLRLLFEKPTVSDLASAIEAERRDSPGAPAPESLKRVSREGLLPLSFSQQRLWILDRMEPGSPVYNNPKAVRLKGRVDIDALGRALNEIVRRHEVLRTRFDTVEGEPTQVVEQDVTLSLPVFDLRDLPESEREAEMQQMVTDISRQPFDLLGVPPMRAALIRLGDEDYVLQLVLHHIVSDAWSIAVLIREVSVLYEAFREGRPSPLAELPIQYADYAAWQRRWLQGEVLERLLGYWKQRLAGLTPLQIPADHQRPPVQTYLGASHNFALPKQLSDALKELSTAQDATLFMTLLAAFQLLLHRYTGQEDIVVGTDFANRDKAETEDLIGFFINQLVLRTDLSGNPTFRELVSRVREVTLGAYAHQDLPFEKLVEALNPARDMSRTPLVQVKLVLLNVPTAKLELPGLTLAPQEFRSGIARFDLTLFMNDTEQGLFGSMHYNTDLFEPRTIARMMGHFETLLASCAAQPDARLGSLTMHTESERAEQMRERQKLEESKLKSFRNIKRKAVSVPKAELVRFGSLGPDEPLPLVVEPRTDDVDLPTWARENRQLVESKLLSHGAILFRGFAVDSAAEFERFAGALCPDLFGENGEHNRTAVSGSVYTPVFYPPEKQLLWHNENSFNNQWPRKIWFGCLLPAREGGETPVVDSRKVFARLDPKLREPFVEKGIMYVRNYGDGLGLDWQTVFRTSSKEEVERRCREARMEFEWKSGDRLRTRSVRPAAVKHPETGEPSWFNQAQHWHIACLDDEVRESLLSSFEPEDLPRHCYYGDGSQIEDSVMERILEVYRELEVSFPWQPKDVLMLDNLLTAHGRNPFSGERKILVAMGEMTSYGDV
ncbi:MAG TPA: SDR family NAD(P)-dependent oxidoreductase [Pyrinomonadaceae bacterium]|jgi:acyl transferase domain-containing protein/alpha-ketoglutarate-dependent taurine dioxygenase|nr:SDR family NAD(P)-dependent oxidoreductase [Pyrinomonadaceae bacterium]